MENLKSEFLFWKNLYLKIQYFKKEENGKLDTYKVSLFIVFGVIFIFGLLFPFLNYFKEFRLLESFFIGVPIIAFIFNLENIFFKIKIKNNILFTKENEEKFQKINAGIDTVFFFSVALTFIFFLGHVLFIYLKGI